MLVRTWPRTPGRHDSHNASLPMDGFTIRLESEADDVDLKAITRGVFEAHCEHIGDARIESLPVMLRDAHGTLCGGAVGRALFGDLHVDSIWVAPELRRGGVGRRLLVELERIASDRGCRWAFANTIVPASRAFFLANEYDVLGTIEGIPAGQRLTFVRKRLATVDAE